MVTQTMGWAGPFVAWTRRGLLLLFRAAREAHTEYEASARLLQGHDLPVIYLALGPVLADGSDLLPNFCRRYPSEEQSLGFRVTFPKGTPEHSILSELKPREQELVINKTANGAFKSSDIDRLLRNLDVETLVAVGVGTVVQRADYGQG